MNSISFGERLQQFLAALASLERAANQPHNEYLQDAVIQRFEFTYELAWKTLRLYLQTKDIATLNAKETLSAALANDLIVDHDAWSRLHLVRNETSHTYKAALAAEAYQFICTTGLQQFKALAKRFADLGYA